MSLWLRSVGDGAIAVCRGANNLANTVAIMIDHPCDMTRTLVYNHDLTEILGDVSGTMDDAMAIVRSHIA